MDFICPDTSADVEEMADTSDDRVVDKDRSVTGAGRDVENCNISLNSPRMMARMTTESVQAGLRYSKAG